MSPMPFPQWTRSSAGFHESSPAPVSRPPKSQSPEVEPRPACVNETSPSPLVTRPLNLHAPRFRPHSAVVPGSSQPPLVTRPFDQGGAARGNAGRVSSSTRQSLPPPAWHEPKPSGSHESSPPPDTKPLNVHSRAHDHDRLVSLSSTRSSLPVPLAPGSSPGGLDKLSAPPPITMPLHVVNPERCNDDCVSSSSPLPSPLPPTSYEPPAAGVHECSSPTSPTRASQARELLASIEQPTPELEAKIQDANEVIDAILYAEAAIGHAHEAGDWRGVLKELSSFEGAMHFSSSGIPRSGFTFPLPKMFLSSACEAYAYLGRVEPAQRSLDLLMADNQLSHAEQTWLMGLIAYVSGHVATSLSLLNSIAMPTECPRIRSLRNRAHSVQQMLKVLNALDFTSQSDRNAFVNIESNFLLDNTYLLLDQCTKLHIHKLYAEKLDAATPRRRPGLTHRLGLRLRTRPRSFRKKQQRPYEKKNSPQLLAMPFQKFSMLFDPIRLSTRTASPPYTGYKILKLYKPQCGVFRHAKANTK